MPTRQEWLNARVGVVDLRKLCTDNQLAANGNKTELIHRLVAKGIALPGPAAPVDWLGLVDKSCDPALAADLSEIGRTDFLGWACGALNKLIAQPAQPLLTWAGIMKYKVRYTAQGVPQYVHVYKVPEMHSLEIIEEVSRMLVQNNPLPPGCTTAQADDVLEMIYELGLRKTQVPQSPAGIGGVAGQGRDLSTVIADGFRGAMTQREPAHKAVTASELMTAVRQAQLEGCTLRLAGLPKMGACGLIRASVQRKSESDEWDPILAVSADVSPPRLLSAEDAEGGIAQDDGYETRVVDGRLVTTSALSTKRGSKSPSRYEATHGYDMYFNAHWLAWLIRDKAVPLSSKFQDSSGREAPWASGYNLVRLKDFMLDLLRTERLTGAAIQRVGLLVLRRCHEMVNDPFAVSQRPTLNVVIEYFITEVVRDVNLVGFASVPRGAAEEDEASEAETLPVKRKPSSAPVADTPTGAPSAGGGAIRMCRSKGCKNRAGKLKNPAGYCGPCHRQLKKGPAPAQGAPGGAAAAAE